MADNTSTLSILSQSLDILTKKEKDVSQEEFSVLNQALGIYRSYYKRKEEKDLVTGFSVFDMDQSFISEIIAEIKNPKVQEKPIKPAVPKIKEQDASIPPELESLVAEYNQSQAILDDEEANISPQKTVAAQVKIAIAHSKIRTSTLANKQRRLATGEKFKDSDELFVSLGSPRSQSKKEALAKSYTVAKQVALTYSDFSKLSPEIQTEIIASAVELNLIGIPDIDTAIQASAFQVDVSKLSDNDKNHLAAIPGGFVSIIHHEAIALEQNTAEYESKITSNEEIIADLQKEGKNAEANLLIEENKHLSTSIEDQSANFNDLVSKQTESFNDYKKSRETRFSTDPDLQDRIDEANQTIFNIHESLDKNKIIPHIYTPMDDAKLLEAAIRKDNPGLLSLNSSYEAGFAMAAAGHPKIQDTNYSPQAIDLYSKGLTPEIFAKIRLEAKKNANSEISKLFKNRPDIFASTGTQVRKISESPAGKEILVPPKGLAKAFQPISKLFSKISDKAGGSTGILRIIMNPWGSFKSWAGKKAGKYIVNKLIKSAIGKAAIAATKKLVAKMIAKGIGKAIVSIGTKIGVKAAAYLGLSATVYGAPIALILAALDVVWTILSIGFKIVKNAVQEIATKVYGEKIKARDVAALTAGVATGVVSIFTGIIGFIGSLAKSTVTAAGSAVGIIAIGTFLGFFFYITSIVVAPLISTLVQLQTTGQATTGAFCSQEVADTAKTIGDRLEKGFNGYYNKSPDFMTPPNDLWNQDLFNLNPSPDSQNASIGATDMFWCNYLVTKSYEENSKPIRFNFSGMISDFKSKGVYLEANSITLSDICPGMAVFFNINGNTLAHVGVVYSVDDDGFTTYESNSTEKTFFYPAPGGNFQTVGSIIVNSFGAL